MLELFLYRPQDLKGLRSGPSTHLDDFALLLEKWRYCTATAAQAALSRSVESLTGHEPVAGRASQPKTASRRNKDGLFT